MSATTAHPSKSKSGVSDTSNSKPVPATPRSSKLGRAASTKSDSHSSSPLQSSRLSVDRSPKSVDLKSRSSKLGNAASTKADSHSSSQLQNSCLSVDRSPKSVDSKNILEPMKISTPPDVRQKQPQARKGSGLQIKNGIMQENLMKVTEQLALVEYEKAQALEELKNAKRLAGEASEKLKEALVAQKRAEENSEVEKFRAEELEQAGIDAAQKIENEWQKEIEDVHNQHAVDRAALLSASQELQKVKHEMVMTSDAKNTALKHADDAMKVAEINKEKVAFFSKDVSRLKALLDAKMGNMSKDTAELVKKLDAEVDVLRNELDRARSAEEKLADMELAIEVLRSELTGVRKAEMHADKLADEWKRKTESLEVQVAETNIAEKQSAELVNKLDSEIDNLSNELRGAKAAEKKLNQLEELVEGLKAQITDAKMAEVDAGTLVDEWKIKFKLLALQAEEANQSASRTEELVKKLDTELEALKHELYVAKGKEKLVKMEAQIEQLRTEITNAYRAETAVLELVDEWKRKASMLEDRLEEAGLSEKSSLDSLAFLTKQLEENKAQKQGAESEIAVLKGMVESLEDEVSRHKSCLEVSDRQLDVAKKEASELGNTIEVLQVELQKMEQQKLQDVNNEKLKASNTESLLEEMNKLINELEITKDEMEKSKLMMEGLTLNLNKVSTEAKETKVKFLIKQVEIEEARTVIEELRSALEGTKETFETMLNEARYENVCLRNSVETSEAEAKTSRAYWDAKELDFVSAMERSEEQIASLKIEMGRVVNSLEEIKHEAQTAKEAENNILIKIKQAEYGETIANEAAEEANSESRLLKERLLDKENELQNITQENDDLLLREVSALQKVKELSTLLVGLTVRSHEEHGDLSNSGIDNISLQEENTNESGVEKLEPEVIMGKFEVSCKQHAKTTEGNGKGKLSKEDETVKIEGNIFETCSYTDKDLGSVRGLGEQSTDDVLGSKTDSSCREQINGLLSEGMKYGTPSPTESQLQKKKRKDLLQKFGSLLKKKSNQKERRSIP